MRSEHEQETFDKVRNAIKEIAIVTGRDITLASGRKSDFYVDCRVAACVFPAVGKLMAKIAHDIFREQPYVALAPVPLGGLILAGRMPFYKQEYHHPQMLIIPREVVKDHGLAHPIDGLRFANGARTIQEDMKVLMIEDVITTGGSVLRAAETLRRSRLDPIGVVVLVDRQEGGREALEEVGLKVWSVFTQEDLR